MMFKLASYRSARLILAGLAGLLVATAGAQVTKQGDTYSFRMKFVKGQKINYTMSMDGKVMGQKFLAKLPLRQQTTAVQGDTGTLIMTIGDPVMTVNGQPFNRSLPKAAKSATMQVDSKGHVIGGPQQQTSVVLPEKPIKIGGSWTAKSTIPSTMGSSMDVVGKYTFMGIERVGAFSAAKFSFTVKDTAKKPAKPVAKGAGLSAQNMAVTGKGMLWINTADCTMIKSKSDMTLTLGKLVTPMLITITRK